MDDKTITIPLDPETARAYQSASPDEKRKLQAILSLWLRELAFESQPSLDAVLEQIGANAKARGLTPETLASILEGA